MFSILNNAAIKSLHEEGDFESVDKDAEEEEESIEMQLPFIMKLMNGYLNFHIQILIYFFYKIHSIPFKLVPVYFGSLDSKKQLQYAEIFKKYIEDKNNFFIISSDLTHWGTKFKFINIIKNLSKKF